MRFILASSSRYPTDKAYGVSFQNTAKILRDLGFVVDIYSPSFHGMDASNIPVTQIANRCYRLLHSQNRAAKSFGYLRTHLVEFVFAIATFKRVLLMRDNVTLWTRSSLLCAITSRFMSKNENRIVLEVHDTNSRMNFFLRFIKFNEKTLVVTPLSFQSSILQSRFRLSNVLAIGNAAPAECFLPPRENSTNIKIGYVGKLRSSGYSNNVNALLKLAELSYRGENDIGIELVGISSTEIEKLLIECGIMTLPPNLKIVEHVPHDEISSYLSTFNIGVVPYPESAYHNQRFPIKIVEYAAAGLSVIICNSFYLDSVIPKEFVYSAEPTGESILESVMQIVNFPDEAARKSKLARNWAQNFTYLNRTKSILQSIGVIRI